MSLKPLFSTYCQGENRVTASLLAVLSRLGTNLTERVLGALLDEPELSLVSFTPLPSTPGVGNPDGVAAPARGLAAPAEAPVYIMVRQERQPPGGEQEFQSSVLTTGGKATVI